MRRQMLKAAARYAALWALVILALWIVDGTPPSSRALVLVVPLIALFGSYCHRLWQERQLARTHLAD
jgi:hypothetical protein